MPGVRHRHLGRGAGAGNAADGAGADGPPRVAAPRDPATAEGDPPGEQAPAERDEGAFADWPPKAPRPARPGEDGERRGRPRDERGKKGPSLVARLFLVLCIGGGAYYGFAHFGNKGADRPRAG